MKKHIALVSLIAILFLLLSSFTALADTYSSYMTIQVYNSSTTAYTNTSVLAAINNTQLYSAGYIDSDGLDTNLQEGATNRVFMVSPSKLALFSSFEAGQKRTYYYRLNNSPAQTSFPVITGVGGNVTVNDASSLEPGDNFTIEQKGYVDTSAGSNKNLVYKQDAFVTYVSSAGSITSAITKGGTYPSVAATNGGYDSAAGTDHTVNLPSGIVSGNLLIVIFTTASNPTVTFSEGWTQIYYTSNSTTVSSGAYYRQADGTEGSTVSVTTNTSQYTSHNSYRITGWSGTPEADSTTGTSTTPDSPSHTASWGARSTLWLAVHGRSAYDAATTSYPTNYTNGIEYSNGGTFPTTASARRQLNAASEDPGTFTETGNRAWVAGTIAIAPAEATVTVGGVSGGMHTITTSLSSETLSLQVDSGTPQTTTSAGVPDNSNNWLID